MTNRLAITSRSRSIVRSLVRRSIISLNFVSIALGARGAEFLLSVNQRRLSHRVAQQGTASYPSKFHGEFSPARTVSDRAT